jgi:hypothetical protein
VKGKKKIFHSNRTVIHPDFQGFGLGIKLINITSKHMKENYGYRIMAKFSATPVYKSMIKQKEWRYLGSKRIMGKLQRGKGIRQQGFREYGIKTYHFEHIG